MEFPLRRWSCPVRIGILAVLSSGGLVAAAEPAASSDAKTLIVSSIAARQAARFHLEPDYPAAARQFRLSGDVLAEVTIGLDGKVESVAVSKGNPILNSAVVAAVKKNGPSIHLASMAGPPRPKAR